MDDYRWPQETLVAEIQSAIVSADQALAWYGLDQTTNQGGAPEYAGVLRNALGTQPALETSPGRKPLVATVQVGANLTGGIDGGVVNVALAHHGSDDQKCFAYQICRLFGYGLAQGWLAGHSFETLNRGLSEIGAGLQRLKNRVAHGKKLVIKLEGN